MNNLRLILAIFFSNRFLDVLKMKSIYMNFIFPYNLRILPQYHQKYMYHCYPMTVYRSSSLAFCHSKSL